MKDIPKPRGLLLFFLICTQVCKGQVQDRGPKVVSNDTTKSELRYDNKYALLIGIDNYDSKSGFSPLRYAVNDAIALKDILTQKCGYATQNIKVLLNKDATRRNIMNALEAYTKDNLPENSQLLVFFAGHGTTTGRNSNVRRGFLVPVDGNDEELNATSIAMDELRQQSESLKPKHILFLVDACYGGLAQSREGKGQFSTAFIKNIWKQRGSEIITAGSADETVLEAADWQHSAFTKVLIDAIEKEEADTNDDGVLVTSELYGYIQQRVPYYAQQKGGKQTPQLNKFSPESGTFLLELSANALSLGKIQDLVPEEKDIKKKLNSRISIGANVSNARVKVNDKDIGAISNNAFEYELAPGFYKLEVLKEKYEPLIKEIEVKPDTTQTIQAVYFNLTQKIFDLKINVQPNDAIVFVNNTLRGAGSQRIELEKGRQSISIQKPGFITNNQIVDLLNDNTIDVQLEAIKASVEITTSPNDAILRIAGKEIGNSPLKFDLDFGKYEIEISKEDYLSKKIKIEVSEPLKFVQNINLELNPSGKVAKKIILDYWNKKLLSNIGVSTVSLLGYLYFDNAVKENKLNTTFLNQTTNKKSRSLLQTGKYACLVFCGMELISSAFSLQKVIVLQKEKAHSVALNMKSSPTFTHLSLCLNF